MVVISYYESSAWFTQISGWGVIVCLGVLWHLFRRYEETECMTEELENGNADISKIRSSIFVKIVCAAWGLIICTNIGGLGVLSFVLSALNRPLIVFLVFLLPAVGLYQSMRYDLSSAKKHPTTMPSLGAEPGSPIPSASHEADASGSTAAAGQTEE